MERQLKPEARKDIIEMLRHAGIIPTAMMDISDGLSSELLHISKESNVGVAYMKIEFLSIIKRLQWLNNLI